jgi:hypothetical protein
MVKKLAVCLPSDAGVFATVPGYGCNGLDDDCKGGVRHPSVLEGYTSSFSAFPLGDSSE